MIVTGSAVLIELVADEQLRRFTRRKQSGDIMTEGLWAWSRHPNYFGELCFWWGLFLFGFSADPSYWWTIVGPVAMTLMFHFASIPMLDRRSLERRPGYAEHMQRVNAVIPGRPRA
jgi:steroid 5-alpha reductase family enzyme